MNARYHTIENIPPMLAFDKTSPRSDQASQLVTTQDAVRQPTSRHHLCCVNCRNPITTPAAALEINGRHFHVCTNPQGDTFEIRLFATATCARQGPATTEYTWFAGYAWQLALCRNCRLQLGWMYSKVDADGFYGLIATRLTHSDS